MLIVMSLLVVFCLQQFMAPTNAVEQSKEFATRVLPLSGFPTLNYAMENADLVGLYFAASWCPMSKEPTDLLGQVFPSYTLLHRSPTPASRQQFAIVFVTSDDVEEDMLSYAKPGWINVPFDSEERVALKKHFATCAKRELQDLGIDRKHEIPSLFIFDGQTHGLLTSHGVEDLYKHKSMKAFDYWKDLQQRVRKLQKTFS